MSGNLANAQLQWTVVPIAGIGWSQLVGSNPRRLAIYFIRGTGLPPNYYAPNAGALVAAGFVPQPGATSLIGGPDFYTYPEHGALCQYDWWSYDTMGGLIAVLEFMAVADPCDIRPQQAQTQAQPLPQSDALQQLLDMRERLGATEIAT